MSADGLVVDLFAGGGGASTGLAWALGRDPDIAINHDAEALALHAANHPRTRHLQNDITRVLPLEATGGRPVSILHASPDCTHFSKAKGGKPRSQHIRDLAWVVIRWAEGTEDLENDWSAESLCATAKRYGLCVEDARCTYAHLWDTMYGSGAYSWAKNPYVWTYTFRPISVEEASKCAIMPQ